MHKAVLMFVMALLMVIQALAQDAPSTSFGTRPAGVPPIVITPMVSELGDQIEVLGARYQIVEMEFVRYDTDEPYIIKFPAINNPPTALPPIQQAVITTQWVGDSQAELVALPEQIQVSGFPAGALESPGSSHLLLKLFLNDNGLLNVGYGPSLSLAVAVGPETIVSLFFFYSQGGGAQTPIDNLLDVIPLSDFIPIRDGRIMQIEQLRTLLNYVEIRAKDTQP